MHRSIVDDASTLCSRRLQAFLHRLPWGIAEHANRLSGREDTVESDSISVGKLPSAYLRVLLLNQDLHFDFPRSAGKPSSDPTFEVKGRFRRVGVPHGGLYGSR